jgi:hypothetical protein
VTSWIFGIFAGLIALLGVILAANALDIGMATFGAGLIVFGVGFVMWLIKDHWDEAERASTGPRS